MQDSKQTIRGPAVFERFASTNAKHVFCVSDKKNAYPTAYTLELVHKVKLMELTIYKVSRQK